MSHSFDRGHRLSPLIKVHVANFREALEMWLADHKGYPTTLESLVPDYLHRLPLGPGGSTEDWDYQRVAEGFCLSIKSPAPAVGPVLRGDAEGVRDTIHSAGPEQA